MGTSERRERQKQELREKILDAARELFLRDGFEAVTMRRIAEQIEYSPTAIYLHFKEKSELFRELILADFAALAMHAQKIGRISDPVERLVKCGRAYVEFGLSHPNHYRLMFNLPKHDQAPGAAPPLDPSTDGYQFMRSAVADAVTSERLRPELTDVDLIARVCWAAVHGIVSLELAALDSKQIVSRKPSAVTELMLDTLIRGMLRAQPARGPTSQTPKAGLKAGAVKRRSRS